MNIKQILPWIIHVIFYCLTGISLKIIGNSLAKYEATSSVLIFHSFKLKLFSTLQTMLCCSAEGSAKYCFFFIQLNHGLLPDMMRTLCIATANAMLLTMTSSSHGPLKLSGLLQRLAGGSVMLYSALDFLFHGTSPT